MRMHRKPHLDERLASCSDILTSPDLSDKNMKRAAEVKDYLDTQKIFLNSNPVHLEIGCGKGKFVLEMAALNPEINFVALEKMSNVIIEGCENLKKTNLTNVHFLNVRAEVLPKYFAENSVERIYLNFSNPLPKQSYIKQRLTYPRFLKIYKNILTQNGEIWQKTDDKSFFEYSLESYKEEGFKIISVCTDLKNSSQEGNVITEHEQRFMDMGLPIYRIVVKK